MLTFHYRDTPNELRQELVDKARNMIESFGFNASESQCAIEAKPPVQWNKGKIECFVIKKQDCSYVSISRIILHFHAILGRASIYILRTAFGVDWSERIKIIYAGDDASDEDAMLVCYLIATHIWIPFPSLIFL